MATRSQASVDSHRKNEEEIIFLLPSLTQFTLKTTVKIDIKSMSWAVYYFVS